MLDFSAVLYKIAQALPGFLLAIVAHEWAHAYVALKFGDPTAKNEGRVSFNPIVHIDPIGTIVVPIACLFFGYGFIGWAKPVPVNYRFFPRDKVKKASFWISFAGPLANLFLGILLSLIFAILYIQLPVDSSFTPHILSAIQYSVMINFLLFGFNLIPFPPLDGSHMLCSFLSPQNELKFMSIGKYFNYIFYGSFFLNMMGIPTVSYLLKPFYGIAMFSMNFFLGALS